MKIDIHDEGNITLVRVAGKLDSNTSPEANITIGAVIKTGTKLVLDMRSCEYVSSAGLRVLLTTAKLLTRMSGKGAIAGLSQDIRDVMEMTGFGNIFPHFTDVDAAKAAVEKG